jgi:hypothetical protein
MPRSSARFVAKGETVYDTQTDLTWMRCSQGQKWREDVRCVGLPQKFTDDSANKVWSNGWRMPTVDELKTIVWKNCSNRAIDDEIFPDTAYMDYRTSSKDGSRCWLVNLRSGDTASTYHHCGMGSAVRLVRSGQ